jgi:hypothetical protein
LRVIVKVCQAGDRGVTDIRLDALDEIGSNAHAHDIADMVSPSLRPGCCYFHAQLFLHVVSFA